MRALHLVSRSWLYRPVRLSRVCVRPRRSQLLHQLVSHTTVRRTQLADCFRPRQCVFCLFICGQQRRCDADVRRGRAELHSAGRRTVHMSGSVQWDSFHVQSLQRGGGADCHHWSGHVSVHIWRRLPACQLFGYQLPRQFFFWHLQLLAVPQHLLALHRSTVHNCRHRRHLFLFQH